MRRTVASRAAVLVAAALSAATAVSADGVPASSPAAGPVALRCGWFDNPTPGNASLFDRDGEWTIAIQGGYQAQGRWPEFGAADWVRSGHGSAGHGCACLRVQTDVEERNVVRIVASRVRPLAACRRDKALQEPR